MENQRQGQNRPQQYIMYNTQTHFVKTNRDYKLCADAETQKKNAAKNENIYFFSALKCVLGEHHVKTVAYKAFFFQDENDKKKSKKN